MAPPKKAVTRVSNVEPANNIFDFDDQPQAPPRKKLEMPKASHQTSSSIGNVFKVICRHVTGRFVEHRFHKK